MKLLGKELLQMVITCVSGPCERNVHVCRLSPVNRARWNSCIGMLHISQSVWGHISKRLMYTVVKQMVVPSNLTLKSAASSLTDKEENVVRYVAGYVIMKLKKKYRKHHHQYASVLDSMKTSLDEYYRLQSHMD